MTASFYNYKKNQPTVWFHRRLEKSNQYCLYCASYIGIDSVKVSNKEHLIAREFIPQKYFTSNDFNLIFRCCTDCNNRKSNIERHLSTTTLFTSESRTRDPDINRLAINKATKDYHPDNKGKLVSESNVEQKLEFGSTDVKMKLGFIAPPQPKEEYIIELAFRHIQGLFSLVNSKDPLKRESTWFLRGDYFHILGIYPQKDWGNPQIKYFIEKTNDWQTCFKTSVGGGHFKAILLKPKDNSMRWFWALEWNKAMRVLDGIDLKENMPLVYTDIPELNWSPWMKDSRGEFRYREQTQLKKIDTLFRDLNQ